jgi:hypothetical protein
MVESTTMEGGAMAHACWPPTHRPRTVASAPWRCPVCGDEWMPRMTGSIHPEPVLPQDLPVVVTTADWLRLT